jgi:CMP-N,N'-diacetyllegionaminic acid synthase
MKIPCIILARKNSKGIKNKNLKKINNKSLIEITIDFLKKTKNITDIIVSTDDYKIANISKRKNCFTIFPRPKKLSNDRATTEIALKHALKIYEETNGNTNITCYVQVTEPNRPKKIMDKCIKILLKNKKIDSCFAAFAQKKNFWVSDKKLLKRISPYKDRSKPRQIKSYIFREDTGVALATRSKFIRAGERIGKRVTCVPYEDFQYNIDINHIEDLKFAKKIMK